MLPPLQIAFEKLEHDREALLSQLSQLPPELLSFRPDPNTWSMLDIAEHLMKVEASLLMDGETHLATRITPVSIRETVGAFVVMCVMRSPIRIKAPATATSLVPESAMTVKDIDGCWCEIRQQWRELLDRFSSEQNRLGLFRHPVSGYMSAGQALRFMQAHIRHHRYQLRRVHKAARAARS